MQMLVTQGGLAGLRAGGVGVGEGLWASAEGPHGSCPILVAEAEAPRTRSVTLPLHADSAEGKGPKLAWPMFQSDENIVCVFSIVFSCSVMSNYLQPHGL